MPGLYPTDLESALASDAAALARLIESFRTYLGLMAAAELDPELRAKVGASDLVQDTMVEAQRDFGQFAGRTQAEFIAWLRQILRSNVLNARRQYLHTKKRRGDVPLVAHDSHAPAYELVDPSATPQAKAVAREQDELVDALIARLSPEHQEVVRLRHAEGLSFVEIGERMNRSADAVRKLWARALDRMQRALADEMQ